MPTDAQIRTALAQAQSNALSYAEMADLLRYAIAGAMISGAGEIQIPWQQVSADGVAQSRMTVMEAANLERKFRSLDAGGVVPQFCEFYNG
jgi:hypothetical protein